VPRFFAATASACSVSAARRGLRSRAFRGGGCRPPAPFGWGSPTHRHTTSDASCRSTVPTRELLPAPTAPGPVFRQAQWHCRFARAALPRAGLGRVTETTRDAFHQLGPQPCDRGRRPRANVSARVLPSGTDSRAAMGSSRRPTTLKLRLTLPTQARGRLSTPASVNGEGAPHRLLQPTLRHVHLQ
jgi:hypothetical protein